MLLDMHLLSPHLIRPGSRHSVSSAWRKEVQGHLCTFRLDTCLLETNKSLLRSKEWHPSIGKLHRWTGDHLIKSRSSFCTASHYLDYNLYAPCKVGPAYVTMTPEGQPTIHVCMMWVRGISSSAGVQLSRTMRLHMTESRETVASYSIHPSIHINQAPSMCKGNATFLGKQQRGGELEVQWS